MLVLFQVCEVWIQSEVYVKQSVSLSLLLFHQLSTTVTMFILFSTSSASGTVVPTAATPTLSVRGLEEKVNKWVSEMREQEERLMRQAAHVNAWDQLLQKGHDQVQQLRDTLNTVEASGN